MRTVKRLSLVGTAVTLLLAVVALVSGCAERMDRVRLRK